MKTIGFAPPQSLEDNMDADVTVWSLSGSQLARLHGRQGVYPHNLATGVYLIRVDSEGRRISQLVVIR
jgi:hypothetical protein